MSAAQPDVGIVIVSLHLERQFRPSRRWRIITKSLVQGERKRGGRGEGLLTSLYYPLNTALL